MSDKAASADDAPGTGKSGNEWLVEFLMERLRRQYDWNVGLNGRASMLLALTGIALTLLLGSERGVGDGSTFEVVSRAAGLALLVVSAAVLLRALRRRSEAVWGASDLGEFVDGLRNADGEAVSLALIERLRSGTGVNETALANKSREIEFGTRLTLAGLLFVAVGSIGGTGAPVLLVVAVLGLLAVRLSTALFEPGRPA